LIGCTFYNGSETNVHRFYNVSDLNRTLLDCIFPNGHGLPRTASQALGIGNTLTVKWSLNIKVLDEYKKPLPNAKVKIIDVKGNETEASTDANGDITTQQLTEAVYSRSTDNDGHFDTTDSYIPYRLIIEKSGYKTYKTKFDLTETTNLIISLKPNKFRETKSR
ncbi:MAG: carboxypeptidase-like regulatory domain-containing protein, partial [Candidatus Heimdallarchaeaceae archaeon]